MSLRIVDGVLLGISDSKIEEIVIPQKIVRSIGPNAFANCHSLRTVIFQHPSAVKNIEEGAFSGCESLCMIQLPGGLEIIWDNAFRGCVKLKVVDLPSSLIYMGCSVFNACLALEELKLPSSLKLIEKTALSNCPHLTRLFISRQTRVLGGQGSNQLTHASGCRVSYH
jgi:hypothetical protein